jgi:hypothetical protein
MMATDWDAWESTLEPAQREQLDTAFRLEPDREGARKRFAAVAYVAAATGHDEELVSERFESYYMPAFAADETAGFGRPDGVKDFGEFYSLLEGRVVEQQAKDERVKKARMAASEAALFSNDIMAELNRFREALPESGDDEIEAWQDTYKEWNSTLAPYRFQVQRAIEAMPRIQKGEANELDQTAIDALADSVANAEGKEREILKRALLLGVQKIAGEQEKRGIGGTFTGSAANTLSDMFSPGRFMDQNALAKVDPAKLGFDEPIDSPEAARAAVDAELSRQMNQTAAAMGGEVAGFIPDDSRPVRDLSEEEQALVKAEIERRNKRIKAGREIDSLARMTDPFDDSIMGTMASGTASTLTLALPLMLGPGGVALAAAGYANMETEQMLLENPDMDLEAAQGVGAVSGILQAAMDKAQLFGLEKLAPNVRGIIMGAAKGEALKKSALQLGATMAFENVVEAAQDLTTPVLQQLVADLSETVPGVDWQQESKQFWGSRLDVALGMVPLIALGAGVNTLRNQRNILDLLSSNEGLAQAGFIEADRVAVLEAAARGDAAAAQQALQAGMDRRSPEVAAEYGGTITRDQVTAESVMARRIADAERRGEIPVVKYDAQSQTFTVTDTNGQSVTTKSREQAATLAYSALDEQDRRAAESTLQVFQELFERGGRRAEVAEVSQRRETGGSLMQAGLISLDELTRGVETRMILDGLSPAMAAQMRADVFGFNRSEMVNGVKTAVSRVFGGANPLTAIEETVHGRWRAMKASRRYTDAQGVRWVRMAEEVAGMKFLPEGMADEAVTSEVLDEAIAEVVKADALGRRKSGGMFSPGLISQGMAAFIRGERNLTLGKTKDARALSRTGGDASLFAGFLRGFKELIKTMLEAGRRIQRAREDGTLGEEYDTFLNDLLGADTQQIHEEAAAAEAVEIDPDNTPFSLGLQFLSENYRVYEKKPGATYASPVDKVRASLAELTSAPLIHETNLAGARKILSQVMGRMGRIRLFTTNDPALALGQGGSGVKITFNPARLNGHEPNSLQNRNMQAAGSSSREFIVEKFIKGAVQKVEGSKAAIAKLKNEIPLLGKFQESSDGTALERIDPDNTPFSMALTEGDQAYLAAVEAGDMATAQRMVDEAARAAGYNRKGVRFGFYVNGVPLPPSIAEQNFGPGYYVAEGASLDIDNAAVSVSKKPNKKSLEELGLTEAQVEFRQDNVFVKAQNPITGTDALTDTEKKFLNSIIAYESAVNDAYARIGGEQALPDMPPYLKQEKLIELRGGDKLAASIKSTTESWQKNLRALALMIRDKKLPYDSLKGIGGRTFDGSMASELVVQQANQIKSADPVTRDDQGNVIPLSRRFSESPDIRFSLASRSLASVAESVISKWATRPEWRDATIRVMRDKLGKLRKDGDWKVSFGKAWQRTGDDSRMAGNRTLASIEAEIPMREALRADELEMEGMETLEQWVMLAFERGAERLKDDRVVSAMLEKGQLLSRSEARRQGRITSDGKEAGDYNDAPSLPPSFYSGKKSGYMPDQMAQELFDDGVIPGPLPGDLWAALRESMDNHAKVNEEFKKAKAAVDAVKKQARNQAKEETYEWAREQRAKIPTAQQRQMMALRTLDALLSVAPPEVRGKVGGFVKMAGLKTDAAREKEIEARLGKLEQAMERYAKKNYVEQIESLLDRYKPKKDAGGKIKSNTTAEASEDIQYASDFYELSPEKQDEVVAGLESIIATSEDSDQVQEAIGKLGVTHLFHRMKESDSIEAEAALKWIQETVKEGRTSRKALDEARKQWVNVAKAAAVSDATKGKPGGLVDAENADAGIRSKTWSELVDGVKGMVSNVLLTLAHQLEVVFGEDSRITTEFHRRAVFATNEAVDMKREIERRRFAAMTTIFGKGTLNHAKRIGALQRVRESGVFLTVDSKTQTVDVPAEIVERLLQGIEAKALGLTDKEASQLIDQWADNEALPANKRKRVFSVNRTSGGRDVELKMSEDEAIQYWLWSKQKASMEQMERDGWTEQSFDQLNDFLSDEAKQLAQFFAEEYAALGDKINPVYRRLFNAPFPQAANYSPIFRDVKTTDTIMDMEAQGQSSGLSSGFIMARNKNARAKLRRTSAITAFLQHAENAAHWITHSELIRDMRAVITDTDVQNAIRSTGRTSAANSLKNRIKQLENKGTEQAAGLAELNKWGNRLLQARAFKALAWKISPIMKQTSAFANPLLGDVPAHEYMRGVAKLMAGKLDVKAMWQSDNIQRRIESGFSAEARIAMQRLGYNGSMMLAAMSKGMLPMQLTDAGWTAAGAAIAFDYYREINKKAGMGDAMAESEALKQVEMMIAVTAQPADSVNRSLVEGNSNPWMKSLWMFASEQRKTLAVEVMAIRRLTKGLSKNKALDVQRVIVAHVVMGATTQLMSGLLSLLMGDADDKEREWSVEEWAAAIAAGPINGLFVFGDMLEYVGRRLFGLHAFESKTLVGQMAAELAGAPKQIENLLEGDPEEQRAALYKLSAAVGNVLASLIGPNPITAADVIIGNPVKDIDKVIQSVTD